MKTVYFFNTHGSDGYLTKLFTGCYCIHVGHWDPITDICWDQDEWSKSYYLKKLWSDYTIVYNTYDLELNLAYSTPTILAVDAPVPITPEWLDQRRLTTVYGYGKLDYYSFALRPIYHLFKKKVPGHKGEICSEKVYNDYKNFSDGAFDLGFTEVPSPCDLLKALVLNK